MILFDHYAIAYIENSFNYKGYLHSNSGCVDLRGLFTKKETLTNQKCFIDTYRNLNN